MATLVLSGYAALRNQADQFAKEHGVTLPRLRKLPFKQGIPRLDNDRKPDNSLQPLDALIAVEESAKYRPVRRGRLVVSPSDL